MQAGFPRFRPAGDTALMVELGEGIDRAVNGAVMRLNAQIEAAAIPGVQETVPTFRSILVCYDPLATRGDAVEAALAALLENPPETRLRETRAWSLPVCYEGEDFAPDLTDVAERTGLDSAQVIERHLAGTYRVYMLGTFPGYGFMGDVDPALSLPRRRNPRTAVPAGSVGITGQLTGIYPVTSPGGWNLIGRCPARLFDPDAERPTLLGPGDAVSFARIDRAEFERLEVEARSGRWTPEPVAP